MSDALIEARGVQRFYRLGRERLHVLRSASLCVARGEFVAIMGKSGSGKSTLLHILGALDVPQDGQVFYAGQPVFAPPGRRRFSTTALDMLSAAERARIRLRRQAFGFVFQFYHLLPELNVLENTLLPRMINTPTLGWSKARKAAKADALAVLERVGLDERLKHRPNELSGGERQRVAIARALIHRPALLLADEPTGNLDAGAGRNIMELLKDLHADGQAIVMVTHDDAVAAYADRVLALEKGELRTGAL
jgi:lipoprotein-releasing system ATP-binding protein